MYNQTDFEGEEWVPDYSPQNITVEPEGAFTDEGDPNFSFWAWPFGFDFNPLSLFAF